MGMFAHAPTTQDGSMQAQEPMTPSLDYANIKQQLGFPEFTDAKAAACLLELEKVGLMGLAGMVLFLDDRLDSYLNKEPLSVPHNQLEEKLNAFIIGLPEDHPFIEFKAQKAAAAADSQAPSLGMQEWFDTLDQIALSFGDVAPANLQSLARFIASCTFPPAPRPRYGPGGLINNTGASCHASASSSAASSSSSGWGSTRLAQVADNLLYNPPSHVPTSADAEHYLPLAVKVVQLNGALILDDVFCRKYREAFQLLVLLVGFVQGRDQAQAEATQEAEVQVLEMLKVVEDPGGITKALLACMRKRYLEADLVLPNLQVLKMTTEEATDLLNQAAAAVQQAGEARAAAGTTLEVAVAGIGVHINEALPMLGG